MNNADSSEESSGGKKKKAYLRQSVVDKYKQPKSSVEDVFETPGNGKKPLYVDKGDTESIDENTYSPSSGQIREDECAAISYQAGDEDCVIREASSRGSSECCSSSSKAQAEGKDTQLSVHSSTEQTSGGSGSQSESKEDRNIRTSHESITSQRSSSQSTGLVSSGQEYDPKGDRQGSRKEPFDEGEDVEEKGPRFETEQDLEPPVSVSPVAELDGKDEQEEELYTSVPASPSNEMMLNSSHHSPLRSSRASNSAHTSSRFKRSRTVLYFDSDDDDEDTSHIKESVILENDSEDNDEDIVLPNVITGTAKHRSPDQSESLPYSTQTVLADGGEDEPDVSAFVVLNQKQATVADGFKVVRFSPELQKQRVGSIAGIHASKPLRLSVESKRRFLSHVKEYTNERSAALLPGFVSPYKELESAVPGGKVTFLLCTWNMAEGRFLPENLSDLLFPLEEECSKFLPDFFVVSTQESTPDRTEWMLSLQEVIGPSHVLAHVHQAGVLYMCVFVRRDLIWHVTQFENCFVQTRAGKQFKTKGALGVAFYLFGASILLINSHLSPHENRLADRIRDYHTIVKNLNFPRTLNTADKVFLRPNASPNLNERDQKKDLSVIDKFEYVFWMGDLNFRIKLGYDEIKRSVKRVMTGSIDSPTSSVVVDEASSLTADGDSIAEKSLRHLIQNDQLCISKKEQACFADMLEQDITFLPTYKFDLFTDIYDSSGKKRSPSYTDRILFAGKRRADVQCWLYDSIMSIGTSDHKPVVGVFQVPVSFPSEEVRERMVFGLGMFDRDVYSKALTRARDKVMRMSRLSLGSAPGSPVIAHISNGQATRNYSISSASSATSNICSLQ